MKLPDDVRQLLVRRFQHKYRAWLLDEKSSEQWPLEIKLGIPSTTRAQQQLEGVRVWISAWQSWEGAGQVIWRHRRWRTLGIQQLPEKLILQQADDVVLWIGELSRWRRAKQRFNQLATHWPVLQIYLPNYFAILADYDDVNFKRLIDMLDWIIAHPNSKLYPRQLPIAGVDSKWLEQRKTLINDLVATIQQNKNLDLDFFQRCGLKAPPHLIRIRVLDQNISHQLGGLADISAPITQLATLQITPTYVFIVENLQTGLAFNNIPNSVIFMRLGYHVDVLAQLPWVIRAKCFYWGDLDTHGFAILNRIRSYIPDIRSLLMDEQTLLHHQALWVEEKQPHTADYLPLLTKEEQAVYQAIKCNTWGQTIRLEQERIAWDYATRIIQF